MNKKIFRLVIIFILLTISVKAIPVEEWNKTFGGTGNDMAYSVQQTVDGGYIVAGVTYGTGSKAWLIKTNSSGTEQWNKTFGVSSSLESVQQTTDGGYILAGWKNGAFYLNAWLIKTDMNGNETWNKIFDRKGESRARSVQQTIDGGYILVGEYYPSSIIIDHAWLIKTDMNGNEIWNKTFGGADHDSLKAVNQTSDGGYILTGTTSSYGAGNDDAWLIKTDINGNEKWNKTFGGTGNDGLNSGFQTIDGGYILTGTTSSYGKGNGDAWIIKTDINGNEIWNKTFGGIGGDGLSSGLQTIDGGYIFAGVTNSYGAGVYNAWIIKTDNNGKEQWNKTFGENGDHAAFSVRQTSDYGYILAGWENLYGPKNIDALLIKVSRDIITPRIKGDIDGDKKITTSDALLYLRYSIGQDISPYHMDKSDDVTCEIPPVITAGDALKVLRKAVGQNINLEC